MLKVLLGICCLLSIPSCVQTLNILYVKPAPNVTCSADPCHTLNEYADAADLYFNKSTSMVLLSGIHYLDKSFVISMIREFRMVGDRNHATEHSLLAKIVCRAAVGWTFTNVHQVTLANVSFDSCGSNDSVFYAELVGMMQVVNFDVRNSRTVVLLSFTSRIAVQNSTFTNNSGSVCGGVIYSVNSIIQIANTNFINNSADFGGAVCALGSIAEFSGMNFMTSNYAYVFGGAVFIEESTLLSNGVNVYNNNTCEQFGGAMAVINSLASFSGKTTFFRNTANFLGGVLYADHGSLMFNGSTKFIQNSNINPFHRLMGTFNVWMSTVFFYDEVRFENNSASDGGGMFITMSEVVFSGNSSFVNNLAIDPSAGRGGAIAALVATVTFQGDTRFIGNHASSQGGAVSALNSNIYVEKKVLVLHSRALLGGGLFLEFSSLVHLVHPSELVFRWNKAKRGGAIFVGDTTNSILCTGNGILRLSSDLFTCFITNVDPSISQDVDIFFDNNTASERGDDIFGGMLHMCRSSFRADGEGINIGDGFTLLRNVSNVDFDNSNISSVSSEPVKICFCRNSTPDCDYSLKNTLNMHRGGTLTISIVAVDQTNTTVPANIRALFSFNDGKTSDVGNGQSVQQTGTDCSLLSYTISSTLDIVDLMFYAEGPCNDLGDSVRSIKIHLTECPNAFELSNSRCVCEERLQQHTNSCNIENQSFTRNSNFWVGIDQVNGTYSGLILQSHCPLDYCKSDIVEINVNNLDSQCNFNHSGILCSTCRPNLSLALGTSQCLECSNFYLALLVPFAAAGIFLVLVLFLLRLTVSAGTLGGLLFYANIVAVNKEIFLPVGATNVLTVFIAWLNLDLGIQTCFYDGMDTYERTWLQYVFPIYIWILAFAIILSCRLSVRISKFFGKHPVSILATLFLLSYAKILRTIIISLSATTLEYPNNEIRTVWLYDGTVGYLTGKHIPLFLIAVTVLLFFFLPITILLFLSQWLQAISNRKVMSWMNSARIKFFLDTYHAPHNVKHRYWPGLLLLIRCGLYIVFAFNTSGNPSTRLTSITAVTLGLAVFTRTTGNIYSSWYLDVVEGSFMLNLGVLAAATHQVMQVGGNQAALSYLSVGIAFVEFLGIIVYHAYLQLKSTTMLKCIRVQNVKLILKVFNPQQKNVDMKEDKIDQNIEVSINDEGKISNEFSHYRESVLYIN